MAHPGFRERLHGHNYRVAVRVEGGVGADGYVVDFGDIKRATREICGEMNERVLVPTQSDCLTIREAGGQIEIDTEDGCHFSLPADDCVLLPIAHSSAEDLATYVCHRLLEKLDVLRQRAVAAIEVTVAETPEQEARYRREL